MSGLDAILKHYGVLGMKWGVRKRSSRTASSSSKETSKLRKKRAFELTDEELKKVNGRLNLEKQYNQLNPTTTARGKAAVTKILGGAGTAVLTAGATAGFTAVGKAVFNYAKKARG